MEKIQFSSMNKNKCRICGKVIQSDSDYCSASCHRQSRDRQHSKDLEVLMRQYREGNWTRVDGW